MTRIYLTILLLSFAAFGHQIFAQKVTVQGYLKDANTGEVLLGATVADTITLSGTVSNYYGFYSITLPAGRHTLKYSYVGYKPITNDLILKNDTTINIELNIQTLDEVVVSSDKISSIKETAEMGTFRISSKEIEDRPAIGGEVDLTKVLQLLPGVQVGMEGTAGLYVRGGSPDQNLILLDGVPVYNANHLFGFVSVFNTDAINQVKLIKGAFPARYGGRLSSVLDISMKEGNNKEFHGEGALSLISAKMMIEGPIKSDKTTFAISARRTYADALVQPFIRKSSEVDVYETRIDKDPSAGYFFYDLTAKVNHRFSNKDRIYLSAYHGKDKAHSGLTSFAVNEIENFQRDFKGSNGLQWGSTIGVLRWNHVIANKLFSNLSLSYSQYRFDGGSKNSEQVIVEQDTTTTFRRFESQTGIKDWTAKVDFDYFPSPGQNVKFGLTAISHQYKPNVFAISGTTINDSTYNTSEINSMEYSAYVEDDIKLGSKISANLGVHASAFVVDDTTFTSIQPRVSLRIAIGRNNSIKASYSEMTQYMHLLVNPGIGVPTDFWVPATEKIAPQLGVQYAMGWFHSNLQNDLEWSVEGYYKEISNVIEYKEGAGFLNLEVDWQDKVESGRGLSYGLEFYLKKSFGKASGWLGYTLSRTRRTFQNINNGEAFPYKYDRLHSLNTAFNYVLSDHIFLSANWVFSSGNAVTLPLSTYIDTNSGEWVYEYTDRNGYRMRAYHRLDLSVRFNKKKKWGERDWIISVYNAYSRKNPFYIEQELEEDYVSGGRSKFVEYTQFPIIPSLSYVFKF